ncbi:transposase InsO family protein [Pseudoclavibacter helvolus]|uniref:Transposase InsO family protein n=2 Tax=Pseudoclavibacter helvolus TaxID=255205 RepID=A0A7W4YFQ1_9MICO|nr:transposase InsO family protein [Pseudoclavibacter helvolus]
MFFEASDGTYGYRRIHADLAEAGTHCSPELVRRLMAEHKRLFGLSVGVGLAG